MTAPLDIDECGENELVCPGLDEFCVNMEGSFYCQCAKGFHREDGVCKAIQTSGEEHAFCITHAHTHTNTLTHTCLFSSAVPHIRTWALGGVWGDAADVTLSYRLISSSCTFLHTHSHRQIHLLAKADFWSFRCDCSCPWQGLVRWHPGRGGRSPAADVLRCDPLCSGHTGC